MSKKQDSLERLGNHINFEFFSRPLEQFFGKQTDRSKGSRPTYDLTVFCETDIILMTGQKRWSNPDNAGKVVAPLVKGDFMYSTGQVIMVDGGLTIPRL